ncbi:MAG TPA: alkaline phosphatase [Gemmatimonadales bacterium]
MKRVTMLVTLLLGAGGPAEGQPAPRRVILFIGDGVGTAYWSAARLATDSLAVERLRIMGLVDNRSSDNLVTDSGAGATVYATGIRTFNGAIGVGPDSMPLRTVLEAARDRGWATGLVATSTLTHATPASFAAHVPSRASEFEIARQMVDARVDVMLGGGRRYFDGRTRPDSVDLLATLRRQYTVVETAEAFRALDLRRTRRLVGLFAPSQMPAAATRVPSLPDMTRAALAVLGQDPDGFFLMVEGSQPDWRGHANQPLDQVTAEMLDFDGAIRVAVEHQRGHPETLIVVVADHETGGLSLELTRDSLAFEAAAQNLVSGMEPLAAVRALLSSEQQDEIARLSRELGATASRMRIEASRRGASSSLVARYTSPNHTAEMTPLFASGPGAERFGGIIDNWRVGRLLLEIVER